MKEKTEARAVDEGVPLKPSRDYSTMTREEAVQHFGERQEQIKANILALPLAEKFHLVGEFLTLPDGAVARNVVLNVARLALAELEKKP